MPSRRNNEPNEPQPTPQDTIRRADDLCQHITRRLIRYMQTYDACRLLIDHNPSRTLWDEVCILVHTADSLIWGYYVGTMEIVMGQYLNELTPADQLTLWLQTDEAQDWQLRLLYFPEELATKQPPIDHDDITSHLLHNYIYPAARRRPKHRTQTHTNAGR
jgi:hypothetical protein